MIILDFILGGNPRVISSVIAKKHIRYNGNFQSTVYDIMDLIELNLKQKIGQNTTAYLMQEVQLNSLVKNNVRNYADLGCLYLFYTSAPKGFSFLQVKEQFFSKIYGYLKKKGIPDNFINGDNQPFNIDNQSE